MTPDNDLSKALRKVRDVVPDADLETRMMQALVREERAEQKRERERIRRRAARLNHFRLSLPALASVAIAAHLVWQDPSAEEMSFTEHRIVLTDSGESALPLSLALHAHDTEFAMVRLDVPHGISVSPSLHAALEAASPDCHQAGCIYEFLHPTDSAIPRIEVRVQKPGRYRLEVEHESNSKLLRQVFVVHASR